MRRIAHTLIAGAMLLAVTTGTSHATHKAKTTKRVTVKCPKCKMTLSKKKTATMTEMVKIKGKTYYCCAACGNHAKPGAKAGHAEG